MICNKYSFIFIEVIKKFQKIEYVYALRFSSRLYNMYLSIKDFIFRYMSEIKKNSIGFIVCFRIIFKALNKLIHI